jgi:glucose-6-phosphate 1-dehydrogenase
MMKTESQMILIFGGTGDLTRRKLIPSLYHLVRKNRLTNCTPIICIGRKPLTKDEYLAMLAPERFIDKADANVLSNLRNRIEYLAFDPATESAETFASRVEAIHDHFHCTSNYLIYLALPTSVFEQSVGLIAKLNTNGGWRRVVFEKPFGEDLTSAIKLNEDIHRVLQEEEIYRVDHYLGKQLVQNILTLRFANEVFSGGWRKEGIDHIQITVAETLGVEKRAGYYDKSGAVRDMIQNHLLQLLSLIAMEPPASNIGDTMRNESVKVLQQLRTPDQQDIVLGQYTKGKAGIAYLDEEGIAPHSSTETYAALRAFIDNDRWQGVPFYLRTGKRLHRRFAEIRVVFRQGPRHLLGNRGEANEIIIRIQPDEGIALAFNVQKPSEQNETESVLMDYCHRCHFGPNTPEAYESILLNVMEGDHSLFPRRDWIESSWAYIDQLRAVARPPIGYPAGSSGPAEADALLREDGREWLEDQPSSTLGLSRILR